MARLPKKIWREIQNTKYCNYCKTVKPMEDFSRHSGRHKTGRTDHCKLCEALKRRLLIEKRARKEVDSANPPTTLSPFQQALKDNDPTLYYKIYMRHNSFRNHLKTRNDTLYNKLYNK